MGEIHDILLLKLHQTDVLLLAVVAGDLHGSVLPLQPHQGGVADGGADAGREVGGDAGDEAGLVPGVPHHDGAGGGVGLREELVHLQLQAGCPVTIPVGGGEHGAGGGHHVVDVAVVQVELQLLGERLAGGELRHGVGRPQRPL